MLLKARIKEFCACAFVGVSLLWSPLHAEDVVVVQAVEAAPAPQAAAPAKAAEAPKDKKDAKNDAGKKKPADQPEKNAKADDAKNKKKAPTPVRRAAAPKLPAADAGKNALEQQMRRQLLPTLKVELSFAIRAAELNEEERKTLIEAAKKWFGTFIADFMKNQDPNQRQMIMQGNQVIWFGGQARRPENPRDTLRVGLAKVVAKTLPKEKSQVYADECAKRDEFARKVCVSNLVAQIDERVILSPDQREKITKLLTEHWDKNETPQVEAFALNGSMWPGVTDQSIFPVLTAAQQAVLKRLNTVSGQVVFGGNMFGNNGAVIDDIDLGDLEPAGDANGGAAMPVDAFSE